MSEAAHKGLSLDDVASRADPAQLLRKDVEADLLPPSAAAHVCNGGDSRPGLRSQDGAFRARRMTAVHVRLT